MAGFGDPITQTAFSIHENRGGSSPLCLVRGSRGRLRYRQVGKLRSTWFEESQRQKGYQNSQTGGSGMLKRRGKSLTTPICLQSWQPLNQSGGKSSTVILSPMRGTEKKGASFLRTHTRAIARLVRSGHVRVIVTTNFDRLMENALREEGIEPTVVFVCGHGSKGQSRLPTVDATSSKFTETIRTREF